MPREWSAMIRIARVTFGSEPYSAPESSSASAISGAKASVSKTESTPCWITAMRSSPSPVSMLRCGRSVSEPSSCSS